MHTVTPLRVLLVEDSTLLLRTLSATLQELEHFDVVATARSEESARAVMRSSPNAFDVIVIDIFLASGSGLGVLRAAKALNPEAHIVVLTNYATLEVRKSCVALGADRVFDKTRQIEDFIAYCGNLAMSSSGAHFDDGPPTVPGAEAAPRGPADGSARTR
jgi:DNA-binding NarL/FixJ family response regulator